MDSCKLEHSTAISNHLHAELVSRERKSSLFGIIKHENGSPPSSATVSAFSRSLSGERDEQVLRTRHRGKRGTCSYLLVRAGVINPIIMELERAQSRCLL
eukprot:scaffold26176_cov66-Phaeocystis_antarctica.AAC.2